ncbi:hypothetical protein SCHPADRAFT_911516 [Schizopora paradoxa]|uniref:Uncharacterized protein n=1 Tax=Schizopora paradoxa TaxID=27342 RepID=A0A0H2RIK1_9AGAM|nr:hypothetical protein SCHPADRAFT_911516 [Schizopora paradoxa]
MFFPPFNTQARQMDSIKWSFRCCSLSAHHKRTSLFTPQPNAPPSCWTLEELVESLYKTAGVPVKALMDKDIDMLIHMFFPFA